MNWSAFRKQIEWPAFSVDGFQVVDSHGEIHRLGDVFGSDGAVRREGRDFIGSTISLAAANATSREEDRHAVGPMISAGALGSTRPRIADLGLPSHLTVYHDQGVPEQPAVVKVFEKSGEAAIQFRQQMVLEAEKIAAVCIPATAAFAQVVGLGILHPEYADEGNSRLDQPPGYEHAHAVEGITVPVADGRWLPGHIKSGFRLGCFQQCKCFFLLSAVTKAGGG